MEEVRATLRFAPSSAQKMRRVINVIRWREAPHAAARAQPLARGDGRVRIPGHGAPCGAAAGTGPGDAMGRKVHPIGFRLGINKSWDSRWFAGGKEYASQLHQDIAIRRLILKDATSAAIARVEIERNHNLVRVFVHTAKPGVFIGRKGATVKELRQHLEQLTGCKGDLKVVEVNAPDLEAPVAADNIAS